nr:PREDICTED: adenine phosphoribosyltransferase-like [Latimeria chalumnae]|eukprot:XP_014339401.1 PREDICTED: adenine phosphoribosyltransferase-like [Latimeria chalumnae]
MVLVILELAKQSNVVNPYCSDICPVLKDPKAFSAMIDLFEEHLKKSVPDVSLIVDIDARGFLFGPVLAHRLGIGFVLVRKKGKLPGLIESVAYNLEYGKGSGT